MTRMAKIRKDPSLVGLFKEVEEERVRSERDFHQTNINKKLATMEAQAGAWSPRQREKYKRLKATRV